MREILFRGKRVNNGEWVYGCYVKGNYDYIFNSSLESNRVIPETVGQYTGLKDKNKQRIFEGDFILRKYKSRTMGEDKEVVKWSCDGFNIYSDLTNDLSFEVKYIEIIGNIHDNPELLKN